MFMKHTISRFFRFFLVAALVAAMAGSLLPSKALGQDAPPTPTAPTVSVSTYAVTTDESPVWTITFICRGCGASTVWTMKTQMATPHRRLPQSR